MGYIEVLEIATEIGSGIINLNLAPSKNEYQNFDLKLIGVYSINCE